MNNAICKFNINQSNDINCSRFIYETGDCQSTPLRAETHTLGLIVKGDGFFTLNGERREVSAGDIYFVPQGAVFSIERGEGMEYSYISFGGWRADDLIVRLGLSPERSIFGVSDDLVEFWMSCLHKAEDHNLDLFSESVLLCAFAHLDPKAKLKNDPVTRVIEYTNSHYTDPKLSLSGIAAKLGYDAKYLSFLFKTNNGINFSDYLRNLRVKHAAFLFEEGVESVKSVAILSGFDDPLYFSKVFKREIGVTPSAYIKKVASPADRL